MWPEKVAQRGTCDIGSCIYKYVEDELKEGKNEFHFFFLITFGAEQVQTHGTDVFPLH